MPSPKRAGRLVRGVSDCARTGRGERQLTPTVLTPSPCTSNRTIGCGHCVPRHPCKIRTKTCKCELARLSLGW
ncbi:hypothetical protein KC356_g44 [Hortaea werneckii]|nr:hypothetical protein KC356_g44 [Hortaea werneckii]